MKKLYIMPLIILLNFSLHAQVSGVGVGTTNPQQKLHLAQPVGTLRIEGLDKNNNLFNGGLTNPATTTYPLYVDSNGVLTLEMDPYENSDGNDAFDNLTLPAFNITLPAADPDGKVEAILYSYNITVTRPVLLEIKYNLSFDVFQTSALVNINDDSARRISTYYTLGAGTRKYGQASKSYFNKNVNNASGTLYNTSTTYVNLPVGASTINFKAEVSSPKYVKCGGNICLTSSNPTYVKLGVDTDSVFMRLH